MQSLFAQFQQHQLGGTQMQTIIDQLGSGDIMFQLEGVNQLRNMLAMSQESALSRSQFEQVSQKLINILSQPAFEEIQNEIKLAAIQSLIQILDISPNHITYLLTLGITKAVKETIETSAALGFIDLIEQCIACLAKISEEVPREILRHSLVPIPINMIDFFDKSTQLKILTLLLNVSGNIETRNEFEQNVLVILQPIQQLLQQWSLNEGDKDKFQKLTEVLQKVSKCLFRLLSTKNEDIRELFESFGSNGLYTIIVELLRKYVEKQKSNEAEIGQINTTSAKSNVFSKTAVSNLLQILQRACLYSASTAEKLITSGLFFISLSLLPSAENEDHDSSMLKNTIQLCLDVLPNPTHSQSKCKAIKDCYTLKQTFLQENKSLIESLSHEMIPRLYVAFNLLSQNEDKSNVIQLLRLLLSEQVGMDHQKFTKFCQSVLRSNQANQVFSCLQLVNSITDTKLAQQFQRYGIQSTIQQLTNKQTVEKLCKQEQQKSQPVQTKEVDYQSILLKEQSQILKMTEIQKVQAEAKLTEFQKIYDETPEIEKERKIELKTQLEGLRIKIQHLQQAFEDIKALSQKQSENSESELSYHEPSSQPAEDLPTQITQLASQIQNNLFNSVVNDNNLMNEVSNLAAQINKNVMNGCESKDVWQPLFTKIQQTLEHDLTTFEFQESGLLSALNILLTNEAGEEESKSDKGSEGYLTRLGLFSQTFLQVENENSTRKLVSLLHDQVSEAEQKLFPNTESDYNQNLDSLNMLQKPVIIELVYKEPVENQMSDQPFQSLQANLGQQKSQIFKLRNELFKKLNKIPVQISKSDNCLILSDFLLRKVKTESDVQSLLDRFSRAFNRTGQKADPTKLNIKLSEKEEQFYGEILALLKQLVEKSISQHMFISLKGKFTEDCMTLIQKYEAGGQILSTQFWEKFQSATAQAIKENTITKSKEDQASEAELELLLAQVEVKSEAFLNLINQIKTKAKAALPKLEQKADVSMDEVLQNSVAKKSDNSQEEGESEEAEDQIVDPSDEEDDYFDQQPDQSEDVEMTDEFQNQENNSDEDDDMSEPLSANQPIASVAKPSKFESSESLTIDELLKKGSDDVEIEIYHKDTLINASKSIFDIFKDQSKPQKPEKDDRQSLIMQLLGSLRGSSESRTLQFSIKEKEPIQVYQKKDSLFEYQKSRTKSQIVEETVDFVQTFCQQFKLNIQDPNLKKALQVLKVLCYIRENRDIVTSPGINLLGSNQQCDLIQNRAKFCLQHSQLDRLFQRQIQDPYQLVTDGLSQTVKTILQGCQFMFSFETRQLYLRCVKLIPVDLNRSLHFLRAHLKSQGKAQNDQDQRRRERQERQRVKVDRNKSFVHQLLKVLPELKARALLEVHYKDEEGTGLGPTLEFYQTISQELRENQNIWRPNVPNKALFPKAITNNGDKKTLDLFKCVGYLIARAIFDDKLVDLPISKTMWVLLLQRRKMSIFDLKDLDPSLYDLFVQLQLMANKINLIQKDNLLSAEERQQKLSEVKSAKNWSLSDYSLYFYDPSDDKIELVAGGQNISVTYENLQQYIDMVLDSIFNHSIQAQLVAFRQGFELVLPINCLACLQPKKEIETLVCGQLGYDGPEWQLQSLQSVVQSAHGFTQQSQAFQWFLTYMAKMDPTQRPKFIQFITGSSRLPNGGLGALEPRLTVVMKKGSGDTVLPSVMTCQNYVKMPDYSSYQILATQFDLAVSEGAQNFTLS